jgi:hypothetical protein
MGFFLLVNGTHAGFAKQLARFFWEGMGDNRKYHMVTFPKVCHPWEFSIQNSSISHWC